MTCEQCYHRDVCWHKEKFCHECEQKIDWSDLEE
jgi:hypothetical protein